MPFSDSKIYSFFLNLRGRHPRISHTLPNTSDSQSPPHNDSKSMNPTKDVSPELEGLGQPIINNRSLTPPPHTDIHALPAGHHTSLAPSSESDLKEESYSVRRQRHLLSSTDIHMDTLIRISRKPTCRYRAKAEKSEISGKLPF